MTVEIPKLKLEDLGLSPSLKPMRAALTDDRFEFSEGFLRQPSFCQLDVFANDYILVVIATELPDNPGTSITNAAEILWRKVCYDFAVFPPNIVMIERYPKDSILDERYSLVRFKTIFRDCGIAQTAYYDSATMANIDSNWRVKGKLIFADPQWLHLEKSEVQRLLGLEE